MSKPQRHFPGSRRPPQTQDEPAHTGGRRGRPKRGGGKAGRLQARGKGFRARKDGNQSEDDANAETSDQQLRFSDLLMQLARRAAPEKIQGGKHPEPLALLDYAQELDLKNKALQEFWTARGLPDKPNKVLPSPRPRGYRTTTKRRVVRTHAGFELAFLTESSLAANPKASADSRVEPPEHKAIYAFILSKLNTDAYFQLAGALNYIIIRGDYGRPSVFLNVHRLNADVVRKAKLLGDHLKTPEHNVASGFMFYDPSRSEFYFEARSSDSQWKLKKLFGPDDIRMTVGKRVYAFHPTAFCQVNASILPLFLEKAEQLLKPKPEYRLVDLYSGFGFFTLHLGTNYGEAWGVDLGGPAIESAQKMATAHPESHARFRAGRISTKTLEKLLPPASAEKPEALLLDPPRQGTEPGVIRALAARNPARILHIFCDMDTLPKEVNQWRKAGFMVSKVVPLDMFPGTDNLEVMVLFIPDRYGILNRINKDRNIVQNAGGDEAEAELEAASSETVKKPYGKPGFGNRDSKPQGNPGYGDRGDKPQGKPRFGDRGDKPQGRPRFSDRGDKPQGRPSFGDLGDKPQGKPRFGDRHGKPQGKPRFGDRDEKPRGKSRFGDRPERDGFEERKAPPSRRAPGGKVFGKPGSKPRRPPRS